MKLSIAPVLIIVEIMIAEYLFALNFTKRKLFWLRFLGYGVVAVVITFWIEAIYAILTQKDFVYGVPTGDIVESTFNLVFYFVIFLMTCFICQLSYKESPAQIFFCCSSAYAIQHISRNIVNLVCVIPVFSAEGYGSILTGTATVLIYAAVYLCAWALLIRSRKGEEAYIGNNPRKVFISCSVLVICIVMSRLTSDNPSRDMLSVVAESIYAILCGLFILYVQFVISENDAMKYEVDNMTEILRCERKQYELSKETIDLINMKCHDIKHQLSLLRRGTSEENIEEIEHAIRVYDSTIKTGNDALDVILTEKKLYCEDKNIQMTCVADGKEISFMNNVDIYSLFGNALSNAIESVSKVSDAGKRCVNVNIRRIDKIVVIHIENYFEGTLLLEDGLPVTEKDKNYHGFGMKSMERTARKYGGDISISLSRNKFNLDVLLPVPGK